MKFKLGVIVFVALCGFLFISGVNVSATPSNNLKVSFIDVGEGDSILIQDQTGFNVLIDGGVPLAGPKVIDYMLEQGVDEIDVMVATHAHKDHIGGLVEVLRETDIPVHQILYNGDSGDTEIWAEFAEAVNERRLTLTAAHYPMTYTWGTSTAYVLNPVSDSAEVNQVNDNQNSKSVVILLDNADVDFLFTGDIGSSAEAAILTRFTPISAEILKVAHHGGGSSSSPEFLSAVSPAEAIISVGDNRYGYPDEETLERLLAVGARIWRTDQDGTIVVLSDGESYSINGYSPLGDYQIFLPIVVEMLH
jgi:beta-lactamase superfamily II metal-dependent hydrolase